MNTNQQLAQQAAEKIFPRLLQEDGRNEERAATIIADTYEPVLKERDEAIKELFDALKQYGITDWREASVPELYHAITRAEAILKQKKGE